MGYKHTLVAEDRDMILDLFIQCSLDPHYSCSCDDTRLNNLALTNRDRAFHLTQNTVFGPFGIPFKELRKAVNDAKGIHDNKSV
tara:strand:+ start:2136 stop:2387 length:252 start_codon:yes stop_codon:yes gene_type:complete